MRWLVFVVVAMFHTEAAAELRVQNRAPDFTLVSLLDTTIASTGFRGNPLVLVVGTAKEAAVDCREWMLTLHKNIEGTPTALYQVIVLNNPWYIPHIFVKRELKDFVPAFGHPLVLLEWKTHFRELYDIPYDFDPRVIVIDSAGTIRLWYRGKMNDDALSQVLTKLSELES